jgi:transcription elongation factor
MVKICKLFKEINMLLRPDSKFSSKLQTEQSTPANIIFDTQTDIIESVQETVLINDEDFDMSKGLDQSNTFSHIMNLSFRT